MPSRSALVVDDHADLRELVSSVLSSDGFLVTTARNGLDAFERLAFGVLPDVVVLDLMMPVMDGWRFVDMLAGFPSLRGIPVVAISALRPDADERRRFSAFLPKPLEVDELSRVVRSLVALAAGR